MLHGGRNEQVGQCSRMNDVIVIHQGNEIALGKLCGGICCARNPLVVFQVNNLDLFGFLLLQVIAHALVGRCIVSDTNLPVIVRLSLYRLNGQIEPFDIHVIDGHHDGEANAPRRAPRLKTLRWKRNVIHHNLIVKTIAQTNKTILNGVLCCSRIATRILFCQPKQSLCCIYLRHIYLPNNKQFQNIDFIPNEPEVQRASNYCKQDGRHTRGQILTSVIHT